jgi:hypothetical protein
LVREFKRDKVGCCKALEGDCGGTVLLCANKELDVSELEGGVFYSGAVCSPGRIRKKNLIMIIWVTARDSI